jgi:hypothetical protein
MTLNFESIDNLPMSLTEFDLDNISGILAEPTRFDWYSAHVLRLCQKADATNLRKIAQVYPDCVAAFLLFHLGYIPQSYQLDIPEWDRYEQMMLPHIQKGTR